MARGRAREQVLSVSDGEEDQQHQDWLEQRKRAVKKAAKQQKPPDQQDEYEEHYEESYEYEIQREDDHHQECHNHEIEYPDYVHQMEERHDAPWHEQLAWQEAEPGDWYHEDLRWPEDYGWKRRQAKKHDKKVKEPCCKRCKRKEKTITKLRKIIKGLGSEWKV